MIGTKVFIRHALSPVNEIFRVRPLTEIFYIARHFKTDSPEVNAPNAMKLRSNRMVFKRKETERIGATDVVCVGATQNQENGLANSWTSEIVEVRGMWTTKELSAYSVSPYSLLEWRSMGLGVDETETQGYLIRGDGRPRIIDRCPHASRS